MHTEGSIVIRTRTIRYRDGRRELFRVLSTTDLASWKREDPLSYERSIVWLEDVEKLPYVRVVEVRNATSRRGRLLLQGNARVVGYSKLMTDAPRDSKTKKFTRRLFYLKEEDGNETPRPGRVIDPRTVLPGVVGTPPATIAPLSVAK